MIQIIEELSLNAWSAIQTNFYDGWILRFADGYTKRSNSVQPLYNSTLPLAEKIDYCESVYRRSMLPVVFKLTQDSNPQGIDQELARRNYLRVDETAVRILDMAHYQFRKPGEVVLEEQFSTEWLSDFFVCSHLDNPVFRKSAKRILDNIRNQVIVLRKKEAGQTVGCGFAALEREFIGIYDIVVAPGHRGRGYGRDIMDGILSAALDKGVKKAYLSVVSGNAPAENLYGKLGFQEIYRYWYRKRD